MKAITLSKEELRQYFTGEENEFRHMLRGIKVNGIITLDSTSLSHLFEFYDTDLSYAFWKKYWKGIKTLEDLKEDKEYKETHQLLFDVLDKVTNADVLENYREFLMIAPIPEPVSAYIMGQIQEVENEHIRLGSLNDEIQ